MADITKAQAPVHTRSSLPVVYAETNQQAVSEILDTLRGQGYNVLAPQTLSVAPNYRLRFDFLQIHPDPTGGEVFKVGGQYVVDPQSQKRDKWVDYFCLGKTPLDRIARAVNILWDMIQTKTIFQNDTTIVYQAVGVYRLATGDVARITGTKEIDLIAIEEEVRIEQSIKVLSGKWKPKEGEEALYRDRPPEEIINSLVRREMAMWRKNRLMRAETGAKERAIRSGMALKSRYTREELLRPFVIPVVEYNPQSDIVREMMGKETQALFGMTMPAQKRTVAPTPPDPGGGLEEPGDMEITPTEGGSALPGEPPDEEQHDLFGDRDK